jgi:hypothetical protein
MGKNIYIAMYDLEGNLLEVFETINISTLAKELKIDKKGLYGCINGENTQTNNRQFKVIKYINRFPKKIGDLTQIINTNEPINKYYKGNYICTYKSVKECSEKNNIAEQNITGVLNGSRKTANGYSFILMKKLNQLKFIAELKNPFIK